MVQHIQKNFFTSKYSFYQASLIIVKQQCLNTTLTK
jgi:hypothetical protein